MNFSRLKQVDKSHYRFGTYYDKGRWLSVWHQLDEVMQVNATRVLEVGPGAGVFKQVAAVFGVTVETLDLDPGLKPDHLGSATQLPLPDRSFDAVCAFQMLEHLPYEQSLEALREMVRVSRRHVVISLPDARTLWWYRFHVPGFGDRNLIVPRPGFRPRVHEFDGEHYWEVNKKGFELDKVVRDFTAICPLVKTYRVTEETYYRFFVFRKD